MSRWRLLICLVLLPLSAAAEEAQVPGTVGRLDLAARLYSLGLATDDALVVVAAVRLADAVALRGDAGWTRTTVAADTAAPGPAAPAAGPAAMAVLSAEARQAALLMAEGDDALTEIAEDAFAETARPRFGGANSAAGRLAAGQQDVWQIAFAGQQRAEIGVFGDGTGGLGWRVANAAGVPVCQGTSVSAPLFCTFTPAENAWYRVTVRSAADTGTGYLLITN
ncbi:MAG: hypothetical protein IAE87_15945 [Rhodobacteraceae bacterium]|jgi:hypothetical protein|nr:hypothetical protein [Paracoccaceae bacterium]